jgi:hypothetical protein
VIEILEEPWVTVVLRAEPRLPMLGRNGREHVLRDHTWAANARAVAALAEQAS